MRIGALITKALQPYVHGHITRYDDVYEPRAFGDHYQSLGTSTLLIESGHWPQDPEKATIRKLNVVAMLSGLWSIAGGSYEDAELELYTNLPCNGKRMFDLLIRGLELRHPGGWKGPVDLGVLFERYSDRATIKEIGDLQMHGGLEEHTLRNRLLPPELANIDGIVQRQAIYDLLQIYTAPSTCFVSAPLLTLPKVSRIITNLKYSSTSFIPGAMTSAVKTERQHEFEVEALPHADLLYNYALRMTNNCRGRG